jgi:hypothetical protein
MKEELKRYKRRVERDIKKSRSRKEKDTEEK